MSVSFDINTVNQMLQVRGLQDKGPVQQFIDAETIRHMGPYTPMLTGMLYKSATLGTVIGTGEIGYNSPYARFQYYGKVMVSPITGSAFASRGEKKILTDRDLVHNTSKHPKAGPFWFERMKPDKRDSILRGAQKVADRLGGSQ